MYSAYAIQVRVLALGVFIATAYPFILATHQTINCHLALATLAFLGCTALCNRSTCYALYQYLFLDGFCYLEFVSLDGQAYPTVGVLLDAGANFHVHSVGKGVWHVSSTESEIRRSWSLDFLPRDDVVGGDFVPYIEQYARNISKQTRRVARDMPPADALKGEFSRMTNEVALEFSRTLPAIPRFSSSRSRPVAGDSEHVQGRAGLANMNAASAMEAARVLLGSMDSLGPSENRTATALDTFAQGITTTIPPSDQRFQRLVTTLGPLKYTPRIEAHGAAATMRRAALNNAAHVLQGAIVGLISPSTSEWHTFPRAVAWMYTDALDGSRRRKHCTKCRLPVCALVTEAKAAGRVYDGNNLSAAATLFRKFGVTSLYLMNIEPNLNGQQLTRFMVESDVHNGYSLVSVDWRVMLGKRVVDPLINMSTELANGTVVSSFDDGGDYIQSLANVRQLFRPTYHSGHSLRRTIVFGDGATQYFELTLSRGGLATRCVPQHEHYYFIKLIMPDMTRPVVLVERSGFDRVLATYRTQATKNEEVARIVLRQSNVTYSISGTQVTPRVRISTTEYEALAIWVVVYSEIQDAMAAEHAAILRPAGVAATGKSVFAGAMSRLAANNTVSIALGAASSVEAILSGYRRDMQSATLDEMSARTLEEHFGTKLDPVSAQNALITRWSKLCTWISEPRKWYGALSKLGDDAWDTAFDLTNVVAVTTLLAGRFSLTLARIACDCTATFARMTGKMETAREVEHIMARWSWTTDKATRMWVTCQEAQSLDFQAATIDIVETFFNLFSRDHAAEIQLIRERNLIDEKTLKELAENDALPFSDFLSEIKLFLGKFNSHARSFAAASTLLNAFSQDCRRVDASQTARMIHVLKEATDVTPTLIKMQEMEFALGGKPDLVPIPLKPINGQLVRETLRNGPLTLESASGQFRLNMLKRIGDVYDMSPIHAAMELRHPNGVVDPNKLRGPNTISPDDKGAALQEALIAAVVAAAGGATIVNNAAMSKWYATQRAMDTIPYVEKVLAASAALFEGNMSANWIAHVTGLAFGGKSKGIRKFVTANDLIVVPTANLKIEWQENLGKLDPVQRATVVTQHEALVTKYASRYVFIDECYAFDPEHLQAICNRHSRSKGVITIGDRRQIPNVFSPTMVKLIATECPCIIITPTTFMPADAAAIFLSTTTSDVTVDNYYCGSEEFEGLTYTLKSDDTLLPGEHDIMLQGTQVGKEMMITRGGPCTTVHEAQGRRSSNTIMHFVGHTMTADLRWLSLPDQAAHMGVSISRAKLKTVFVVNALRDLRVITWVDDATVNGRLSSTAMYGGTSWDLVEPRTQADGVWEHVYTPRLPESHLLEQALTNPITIGTVFGPDGEAISASEIRTNVELVSGVTFRDEGIPCSDAFDHYTTQPRDHPGADIQQALTRAGPVLKPKPVDFENADRIVSLIFEEYIDKKKFFSHLSNSKRATLNRLTRDQILDGCYANYETSGSSMSFAFLKPEFAKKPTELGNGPAELKAQGVVTASALQQAIFSDACDALTHAWARSHRPGKMSPVGLHEEEVEGFLATFENSYELDIEKQDSSHKPVHVIVAERFLEMASDKLGLGTMATELRTERTVRMMSHPFKFVLATCLASGDPWTLIINKIMAVSSLISVANLTDVRVCQSGDDVTCDRVPNWRGEGIQDQSMANKGLRWKVEERNQRRNGVTFISRAALPNQTFVYKALRTILKYSASPRNSIQHMSIIADAKRILAKSATAGLEAYVNARALVWGGDPSVMYDMWTRALHVAQTPFEELPAALRLHEPHHFTIRQRDGGCFGYALAACVESNVAAINAVAHFRGPVSQSDALIACRDNHVPLLIMNERWANKSRSRLLEMMNRRKFTRSFVVVYDDHAVAVVPNTITVHTALGKRTIAWRDTTSRDIIIKDFD